jgi:NAD(P)-dependent dehydrogenase (short-subunit alcohol dehydrogenase family)
VTGGRIKIGFHLACKLLRDGAHVTITTRFPRDAARRFAALPDAADLADRLRIVGIDLRSLPDVLALGEQLAHEVVDIVVHNAAQTVRRPAAYHEAWALAEAEPLEGAAAALWSGDAADVRPALAKVSRDALLFPAGATDVEGLPLDLRQVNSWRLAIEDVGAAELLETHVVNAMVPFLLTSRLVPAMRSAAPEDRYIVNVSAVEGQFVRPYKTPFHPHTNMAKAALNMMTRTSAAALAEDGIFMTSVDTGWITDEDPAPRREAKRRRGFCPPLDVIDGAARVYDPIVRGVAGGERLSGVLLKDYRPAPW